MCAQQVQKTVLAYFFRDTISHILFEHVHYCNNSYEFWILLKYSGFNSFLDISVLLHLLKLYDRVFHTAGAW